MRIVNVGNMETFIFLSKKIPIKLYIIGFFYYDLFYSFQMEVVW